MSDDNALYQSYCDPNFMSQFQMNHENVLDYFSNLANPFYDKTCNNQVSFQYGMQEDMHIP